jgi:phage-related protein
MINYFTYDGKSSRDFNLYISGAGTYNAPARKIDEIEIPGMNGVLHQDSDTFENVDITFSSAFMWQKTRPNRDRPFQGMYIYDDLRIRIRALRAWLLKPRKYVRFEDSYHPDEYRMAIYKESIDPTMWYDLSAGQFDLTFNCKPQRYLKSGEDAIVATGYRTIWNPTDFDSKPLIRAYGTGSFTINGVTVQVVSANEYTDIDCELYECYKGNTNCNVNVRTTNYEFPTIPPDFSDVYMEGIWRLEIVPRWWTI